MYKSKVTIEYIGKIPSVNSVYGRNPWGGLYTKAVGVKLKSTIAYMYNNVRMNPSVELGYHLDVYAPFYNASKDAKSIFKKRDTDNMLKVILDSVCDALHINDTQFFETSQRKIHSKNEKFIIKIYELDSSKVARPA